MTNKEVCDRDMIGIWNWLNQCHTLRDDSMGFVLKKQNQVIVMSLTREFSN